MFDSGMTRPVNLPVWPVVVLALSVGAGRLVAETSANPYLGIADRNAFRLKPREDPPWTPPPTPLAEVRIVGITTFGGKHALLKVRLPATSPEPAKELSCILTVGQRKGPVEVLEINEDARSVTVNTPEL